MTLDYFRSPEGALQPIRDIQPARFCPWFVEGYGLRGQPIRIYRNRILPKKLVCGVMRMEWRFQG
jgi:hypothetical protein